MSTLVVKEQDVRGWRASLVAELNDLGRWFEGRYVAVPDASDEVVPASRYQDTDFLREAIGRAANTQAHSATVPDDLKADDIDLRIAVSRFTRQYASSITGVALCGLANGVALDLSAVRCKMIIRSNIPFLMTFGIDEDGIVRCAERPTTWPVRGRTVVTLNELRELVWAKLYGEHLAPLFVRAREVTKVSPKLMWTNAGEWVAGISDAADEYLTPERAAPFVADRIALLEADTLPGVAGPNPLKGLIEWSAPQPDMPHGAHLRHACCVTFMLQDRLGRLCENCPFLPEPERLALIRERHGVSMGAAGGPAERRAIEIGRKKLGLDS